MTQSWAASWWAKAGAFLVVLVLAAGLAGRLGGGETTGPRLGQVGPPLIDVELVAARLESFADCEELADWYRDAALAQESFRGFAMTRGGGLGVAEMAMADDGGARMTATPAAPPEAGVDYSGTNVQEAGVDEADTVKTDGRVLYTVAGGRLQVVDPAGPRILAAAPLPEGWGHELLLDGDRLLVLTHGEGGAALREDTAASDPHAWTPRSVLTLLDVADPAVPREVATTTLEGHYVSARMTQGVARVVVRSHPTGPAIAPMELRGPADEARALDRQRSAIRDSAPQDWLPWLAFEAADGQRTVEPLVDCSTTLHPQGFAGFGMVSVLSLDLHGDGAPDTGASVAADGDTVYASADNLYVAITAWERDDVADDVSEPADSPGPAIAGDIMIAPAPDGRSVTGIHQFDISDPAGARYAASGSVPGRLLNQWSLSEHNGVLRVATTEGEMWARQPGEEPDSVSAVRVLAAQGEELVEIGHVGDLGQGERIYAVRFMGDVGYVVTFRETDPLYTLDLSDPRAPRTLGELKIMGYSAYLHPVGDGLLLGVGQDATEQGQLLGTQLSLFDVSDLRDPQRVHAVRIDDSSSSVEHDHRAFLWWGPRGLAVVPVERWSFDRARGTEDYRAEVVGFTVGAGAITETGRVTHVPANGAEPWPYRIERSVVIGDRLITVSSAGVKATTLDFDEIGWAPFGP